MPSTQPVQPNWVDVADLRAQQAMAHLAEQVLYLTWAQIILGVVGTIALFVTFWEARKATATALRAVRVQQNAERAVLVLLKPYFYLKDMAPGAKPWDGFTFRKEAEAELSGGVALINRGKSLALLRRTNIRIICASSLPPTPEYPASGSTRLHDPVDVGTERNINAEKIQLTADATRQLDSGEIRSWVFGEVEYEDLFADRHRLRFCFRFEGDRTLSPIEDGGDSYWHTK